MQNLHATGGQSHIICSCVAASCMQIVPVWPPFRKCAGPMYDKHAARTTIIELKNQKTLLKNLRIFATHVLNKCYPSTLCMARSSLIRRYLYFCRLILKGRRQMLWYLLVYRYLIHALSLSRSSMWPNKSHYCIKNLLAFSLSIFGFEKKNIKIILNWLLKFKSKLFNFFIKPRVLVVCVG